jgi:hypothetical protein
MKLKIKTCIKLVNFSIEYQALRVSHGEKERTFEGKWKRIWRTMKEIENPNRLGKLSEREKSPTKRE